MSKMTYWMQLKDPRWQEVRLRILNRAEFRCEECGEKPEGESLEIHHRYYEKGKMAWEYPDAALLCVCNECHIMVAECERTLLNSITPRDTCNAASLGEAIRLARNEGVCLRECVKLILSAAESAYYAKKEQVAK